MILLYHNLVPASAPNGYRYTSQSLLASVFERHMRWLSANFQFVHLDEYLEYLISNNFRKNKKIAITFDDGTATSFACAYPILQELKIPATFFVTTCHLEYGQLMPDRYLNAIFLENVYSEITVHGQRFSLHTPRERIRSRRLVNKLVERSGDQFLFTQDLVRSYPLPEAIRALYQGMSYQQLQVAARSNIVEIGAHTLTHPNLSALPIDKQQREIVESRQILEAATGKSVRYFAYPSGQYTQATIDLVKKSGYTAAFATIPRNLGDDPLFEVERVGVYSSSLLKLFLKSIGVAELLRDAGLRVG